MNTGRASRVMPSPRTPVSLAAASRMDGAATVSAMRGSRDSRPIEASRLRGPAADRRCREGFAAKETARTIDSSRDNGMEHLATTERSRSGGSVAAWMGWGSGQTAEAILRRKPPNRSGWPLFSAGTESSQGSGTPGISCEKRLESCPLRPAAPHRFRVDTRARCCPRPAFRSGHESPELSIVAGEIGDRMISLRPVVWHLYQLRFRGPGGFRPD